MATANKVTRIKANDDTPKKATAAKATVGTASKKAKAPRAAKPVKTNVFARIWGYFKGAWTELRMVRWPNRQATWGLTVAVIVFSLFFVALILLLDLFFDFVFEQLIA